MLQRRLHALLVQAAIEARREDAEMGEAGEGDEEGDGEDEEEDKERPWYYLYNFMWAIVTSAVYHSYMYMYGKHLYLYAD